MSLTHRSLQHRGRALVALLALALAALGLAACGSSGGGGDSSGGGGGDSSNAQVLLTQTFTGLHKIDSGKVNLQLNIDAQGDASLRGPIKVSLTGPFASAGSGNLPRFDLALDAHAADQGITAGLTSTSDRLFVKLGGTAYEVPATLLTQLKQSFRQQSQHKSGFDSLSSLGIHPMNWLKDPSVVGSESVGGVDTEHVTAQIDVSALLDDVDGLLAKFHDKIPAAAAGAAQIPDKLPADTRQKIESAIKSAKVDVWTGKDDKTLRKLALALSIEPSSGSVKSATVDLSVEIDDLNAPQTIEAPSSVHPLSELLGQVQGLLGGAGLGGGSALGGSSSGSGSSKQVDAYAQCLQQAGGDATKIQQCAALLTK